MKEKSTAIPEKIGCCQRNSSRFEDIFFLKVLFNPIKTPINYFYIL